MRQKMSLAHTISTPVCHNKGNHKIFQLVWLVPRLNSKLQTFRVQVMHTTSAPNCLIHFLVKICIKLFSSDLLAIGSDTKQLQVSHTVIDRFKYTNC